MNTKNGIRIIPGNDKLEVELKLPWPPSVNSAYRLLGYGHAVKSKNARAYQKNIACEVAARRLPKFGKAGLRVLVVCFPPDKQKRDLDNIGKVLLDTLQDSGLYEDDSQIDDVRFVRRSSKGAPGHVHVTIQEL